jgi:arylsulfatase A-like enzyme
MNIAFEKLHRSVFHGVIQGVAAWSAYAVVEFVASSLFFRVARPYAVFAPWHWGPTALLLAAYLGTGAVVGVLAGAGVAFLSPQSRLLQNNPSNLVVERLSTLVLLIAFAANLGAAAVSPREKTTMLLITMAFAALVVASLLSEAWSKRIGLLCNPWIIAVLLLGAGQQFAFFQLQSLAEMFGTKVWLWSSLLIGGLATIATAAVLLGRRLRLQSELTFGAWVLGLVLLAASAWIARASPAQNLPSPIVSKTTTQPNVIVLVMDTVRADHLSVYGYGRETTPNLKRLAEDSAVYERAISASDFTLTSHATLFTGTYGSWHGAHCQPPDADYGQPLAAGVPTLAEMLSSKGYRTMGVAANLYLRGDFGLERGFQTFRIPRPVPLLAAESWYMLRNGIRRALNRVVDTSQFDRLYSRGVEINQTFFEMVKETDLSQAPFFAFFNYMDAHFPYIPPAPFDRLFPGKDRRMLQDDLETVQSRVVNGESLPEGYTSHSVSQYDGGIAYIDFQIGQIVHWLKDQKLYDNTMIIVTSDHGEAFGEKKFFLHGNSSYQNLLHVALLVKYPNSAHKGVVEQPVSTTDVVPTVLDILRLPIPPTVQGKNLLDAASLQPREIFGESFPCPVIHTLECVRGCMIRSVIAWPNKFITSSSGKYESYDLSNDPDETRNLFGSRNPAAQQLGAKMASWIKSMPRQSKQQLKLDPEVVRRLKSLGYIQ